VATRVRDPKVRELTEDESHRLFDRAARRYLKMSGKEFLRRWGLGEFRDDDRPEVTHLAMLIPFAR
jgi:hypothetical protein